MYFPEICSKALYHISTVPPRYYKPVLMTFIPIVTQLLYKKVRLNMYRNSSQWVTEELPLVKVFEKGTPFMNRRNEQHKFFCSIIGIQAVFFFALALRNRYYLFPALYTLGHLVWTDMSKRREYIKSEIGRTASKTVSFCSMDGEVPFDN